MIRRSTCTTFARGIGNEAGPTGAGFIETASACQRAGAGAGFSAGTGIPADALRTRARLRNGGRTAWTSVGLWRVGLDSSHGVRLVFGRRVGASSTFPSLESSRMGQQYCDGRRHTRHAGRCPLAVRPTASRACAAPPPRVPRSPGDPRLRALRLRPARPNRCAVPGMRATILGGPAEIPSNRAWNNQRQRGAVAQPSSVCVGAAQIALTLRCLPLSIAGPAFFAHLPLGRVWTHNGVRWRP